MAKDPLTREKVKKHWMADQQKQETMAEYIQWQSIQFVSVKTTQQHY